PRQSLFTTRSGKKHEAFQWKAFALLHHRAGLTQSNAGRSVHIDRQSGDPAFRARLWGAGSIFAASRIGCRSRPRFGSDTSYAGKAWRLFKILSLRTTASEQSAQNLQDH